MVPLTHEQRSPTDDKDHGRNGLMQDSGSKTRSNDAPTKDILDINEAVCRELWHKDKVVNIELKARNCSARDIKKDMEKLVKERQVGNWFHCLANIDNSTLRVMFEKLEQSFQSVAKPVTITPLIVFCFCVLEKNWAIMKCLDPLRESVSQFFDLEYTVAKGSVNVTRDNGWRCIRGLK